MNGFAYKLNACHQDGLQLCHWRKKDEPTDGGYPFAKFNKPTRVPHYTRDEYLRLLSDPDWTEEETTLLFDLCRRFELRFVVIHDRFRRATTLPEKV